MGLKEIKLSDLEYVAKFYGHETAETIGLAIGRSKYSVHHIFKKMRNSGQLEYWQSIERFYPKVEQPRKRPQSGYRGIKWASGKWEASYRGTYIGRFTTVEEARTAIEAFKQK